MIDAHEQGLSIIAAEAQVGGSIAGKKAAQERSVGSDDADAAGARGEEVALGIAFHAKPVVKESARHSISNLGLDGILYLIGLRDRETVV